MQETYPWDEIEERLCVSLDKRRYEHTLGVAYTAWALALCHGADLSKARLAGLLHDCAKCLPAEEMKALLIEQELPVTEYQWAHPALLHAIAGPVIAFRDYGIFDAEINAAIRFHTTGRPEMSLLEKIIYVADYIEPNRKKAANLDELRRLAFDDLDACLTRILAQTIGYVKEKGDGSLDPMTEEALRYYTARDD